MPFQRNMLSSTISEKLQCTLVLTNKVSNLFFSSLHLTKSLGLFIFGYENSHTKPRFNEDRLQRFPLIKQKYWFPLQILSLI